MKQAIAPKPKDKENPTGSQGQPTPAPNLARVIMCEVEARPNTIMLDSRKAGENDLARQAFIDKLLTKLNPPVTGIEPPLLDEAQSYTLLKYFVQQNCREMVSALLKKGAPYIFKPLHYMPFHLALISSNPDRKMVEIFLNHDPNLINLPAYTGETPLALIVFSTQTNTLNQNIEIINMLLELGVDPYKKLTLTFSNSSLNLSVMDLAIRGGFWQIIKALARTIPPPCAQRDIDTLVTLNQYHGDDLKKFRFLLTMLCKIEYIYAKAEDESTLGICDLSEILQKIDNKEIKRFTTFERILSTNINLKGTLLGILDKLLCKLFTIIHEQLEDISFEEILSIRWIMLQHLEIQNGRNQKNSVMMQKNYLAFCAKFFSSFIAEKGQKLDCTLNSINILLKHLEELDYSKKICFDLNHFKAEKAFCDIVEHYNFTVIEKLENYLSSSKDIIDVKIPHCIELLRILKNASRDHEIYSGKHNLLNRAQGVCLIIQALLSKEKDDILSANNFIKSYSYLGFTELYEWQEFKNLKNEARIQMSKRNQATLSPKSSPTKQEKTQDNSNSIDSVQTHEIVSPSLGLPLSAELTVSTPITAQLKAQDSPLSLQEDLHENFSSSSQNASEFNSPSSVFKRHTLAYDKIQNILSEDEKTIVDLFELPPNVKGKLVCTDATENRWAYFELDPEDFSDSREHNRFFAEFSKAKPHFVKTSNNWVVALAPGGVNERVFSTEQIKQEPIKSLKDKSESSIKIWRLLRFNRIGDHADYNKSMGNLHYRCNV